MPTDITIAPALGRPVVALQGPPSPNQIVYDAVDLRRLVECASAPQDGVFAAGDWKVSERATGPNMQVDVAANLGCARVRGNSIANQGSYVVAPHATIATLDVPAAHATLPRADLVCLEVRDNAHDGSGQNDARVRYLAGTATTGATRDNPVGAPALPANAVRLGIVEVPAVDTTISNGQIRDRRPWARGARQTITRTSADYTISSTTTAAVDAVNLNTRIECSGAPIKLSLRGAIAADAVASAVAILQHRMDGAVINGGSEHPVKPIQASATIPVGFDYEVEIVPTPGSHVFAPYWRTGFGGEVVRLKAGGAWAALYSVEEIVRQNASNG